MHFKTSKKSLTKRLIKKTMQRIKIINKSFCLFFFFVKTVKHFIRYQIKKNESKIIFTKSIYINHQYIHFTQSRHILQKHILI